MMFSLALKVTRPCYHGAWYTGDSLTAPNICIVIKVYNHLWCILNGLFCRGCHSVTSTVYPKKYARGFCFAVLCCGYTLTDFPISIRLTSPALWQSNDCPSASKATLMNMDKYFMWIHYERLHDHNKAKHNKTVCIFLGIYCIKLPFEAKFRVGKIIVPNMKYTHLNINSLIPRKCGRNVKSEICNQGPFY